MKASSPGTSTYRSLAQKGARVTRQLDAEELPRLQRLCEDLSDVRMALTFDFDDFSRVRVVGEVAFAGKVECHRCNEYIPQDVVVPIEAIIAFSEPEANEWSSNSEILEDILVVSGKTLSLPELVEDDMILGMPSRVCDVVNCERKPAMRYGARESNGEHTTAAKDAQGEGTSDSQNGDTRRPFAGLRDAMLQMPAKEPGRSDKASGTNGSKDTLE